LLGEEVSKKLQQFRRSFVSCDEGRITKDLHNLEFQEKAEAQGSKKVTLPDENKGKKITYKLEEGN
jgi:hypothetical protein